MTKIQSYLQNESGYYLHRPGNVHIKRNHYSVASFNQILCCDTMHMTDIKKENDGYSHVLVCVDMFSRKAFAQAIKDVKCATVIDRLKIILKNNHYNLLYTDQGTEFKCAALKRYLDKIDTSIYFSVSYVKVAIVERFIRTLRLKIERYMTTQHTRRYIDVLQDLVTSYNQTYHRTIGRSPASVNAANRDEVFQYQYLSFKNPKKRRTSAPGSKKYRYTFKVGDFVRYADTQRRAFAKESKTERWSEEVFKVKRRFKRDEIPIYKLEDLKDREVAGTFYAEELFPAKYDPAAYYNIDPKYPIKKIGTGKNTRYRVRFQGWSKDFETDVDPRGIKTLRPGKGKRFPPKP